MTMEYSRSSSADMRAQTFVDARLSGSVVSVYPGEKPAGLDEAYRIQDQAIDAFPATLTGWKVGGINGRWRESVGVDRLVGPVFDTYTHTFSGQTISMPVFADGFAAVEAEVVATIARDVPEDQKSFSTDDAVAFIKSLHVGIEIASSPFPEINEHGPLVTISDFGNNRGLITGEVIPGWFSLAIEDWVFETVLNGKTVGRSAPLGMPGGPVESVRFALENTARRGRPIKAGMRILTGAATGVHQAFAGDEATITLAGQHAISCRLVPYSQVLSQRAD
ncbi:2-keto-4-pentenoate hydratase [Henriciella marina]|uniref:2-keto-4-pentenoate hydratase n=1 Tax=Henriciella marina TaxID=453851 RepID=UPI00035E1939|nr:hypothetical protein [Henriciella marina]